MSEQRASESSEVAAGISGLHDPAELSPGEATRRIRRAAEEEGARVVSPIDVTYLADTVLMFRFFEADGAVHKALSVVKKRTGPHENTIRQLFIDSAGIRVGPPLDRFRGVLPGVPVQVEKTRKTAPSSGRRVNEKKKR